MMKLKSLVHFSIPVTDLGKSDHFYRHLLGMEKLDGHERMSFLRLGNDHIVLVKSDTVRASKSAEGQFRPGVHHAFLVDADEYDRAKDQLTSNGVRILGEELRDQGVFTGRSLYFSDPDGNELEIIARKVEDARS
jgi:catechol-2,3-dioxygenase